MPTQRDIAAKLGVSIATVSLALRHDPQISQDMQARVLAMASELGYVYQPRRDTTAPVARLAFVISYNMTDTFYAAALDAAEKECQAQGATMRFVQTARFGPVQSMHDLDDLDGILLIGTFGESVIRAFEEHGLPIVLIDNNVPGTKEDRILVNNEQSLYRTTYWLHAQGHRRIAYIHGPDDHWSFRERLRGYERAMEELVLEPLVLDSGAINGLITFEDTERRMTAWLRSQTTVPFTAVAACNDKAAIGVMHALLSVHLRVPEDVSVVGFDDIDAAAVVRPALTTHHVHRDVLGRVGARSLLDRLQHPRDPAMCLYIDTELVIRESSGPASEVSGLAEESYGGLEQDPQQDPQKDAQKEVSRL